MKGIDAILDLMNVVFDTEQDAIDAGNRVNPHPEEYRDRSVISLCHCPPSLMQIVETREGWRWVIHSTDLCRIGNCKYRSDSPALRCAVHPGRPPTTGCEIGR